MKLVRDRIPEIVFAKDQTEPFRQVTDHHEHRRLLDAKLDEELAEWREDRDPTELADLLAVVRDLAEMDGIGWDNLQSIEADKRARRGGFLGGVVWLGEKAVTA